MLKTGVRGDLAGIREKVYVGERLSFKDGLKLFESNDVMNIGRLANHVREKLHGDHAYFTHKYRLYPTNICVYRCRFCAFRVRRTCAESPAPSAPSTGQSARPKKATGTCSRSSRSSTRYRRPWTSEGPASSCRVGSIRT